MPALVNSDRVTLERRLGVWSIAALVIGETIAVGIFLTPAAMARSLGSPFWIMVVWLVVGGMAAAGALCYGELAARFPAAGGGYVYLREAYGQGMAFLYGWKCLLVMDPGITAVLAMGFTSYLAYLIPLGPAGLKLAAIGLIGAVAGLNVIGVRFAGGVVRLLTGVKLLALGAMVALALLLHRGDWSNFVPFLAQRSGSEPLPGAFAPAVVSAFFAFGGWWEIAKLAGEARDPERTFPRGLLIGVVTVTAVYLMTSAVFVYLVPMDRATDGQAFAAQAGEALLGPAGGTVFSVLVMISVLGSLVALLMALPRAYYAMARDRVFFRSVGELHPRFGTPMRAILIQASTASLLVALGTFEQVIAYFIFVTVGFVGLAAAGLFRLRRATPFSRYQTPGFPVTALIFLGMVAVLLALLAGHNPLQAGLGLLVVGLGAPVYLVVFRGRRSR